MLITALTCGPVRGLPRRLISRESFCSSRKGGGPPILLLLRERPCAVHASLEKYEQGYYELTSPLTGIRPSTLHSFISMFLIPRAVSCWGDLVGRVRSEATSGLASLGETPSHQLDASHLYDSIFFAKFLSQVRSLIEQMCPAHSCTGWCEI